MALKKQLLVCTAAAALTGGAALPAAAAPWTRGYVVGAYEYAFRYGGRPDFARGAEIEPGVDCPHGSSVNFSSPDETKKALIRQKWRSQKEIDWVTVPPGLDRARDPSAARETIWARAISYRGYKKGIETYVNPWAAEDPGQPEVASRIAEGFNLDGKVKSTDFVSPDGENGIDNALYRACGCDAALRGNVNAQLVQAANVEMQAGLYTIVIRLSGNQDPTNDSGATFEIGYSPDKIVKDARGDIAVDYSYRILQSAQYTKLKATIKNGVVETELVEHLHMPRIAWVYNQTGDTNITKGKIRLNLAPEGLSGTGLIGGYRNWRDLYTEKAFATAGGRSDVFTHEDQIALYYALRRNADGMLNPEAGNYDGISTVYRVKMVSVVDPDTPLDVPIQASNQWRMKAFEAIQANTIKSIETRIPQGVPPGTPEAEYPRMEHETAGLPSREYLLETLDRPHYLDGESMDGRGYPIDDHGNRMAVPENAESQVQQQLHKKAPDAAQRQ